MSKVTVFFDCSNLKLTEKEIEMLKALPRYKKDEEKKDSVRVVRTWVDHEYRAISFLLESESFDEVEEGYRAPEINYMQVTIKKHDTETVNEKPRKELKMCSCAEGWKMKIENNKLLCAYCGKEIEGRIIND